MAADYIETYIDNMNFYTNRGYADTKMVEDMVLEMTTTTMSLKYKIPNEVTTRDFHSIIGQITAIAHGQCPATDLGLDFQDLDVRNWSAPARMDLALTYQCNNNCYFCYMGGPRKTKELTKEQWVWVLNKLWEAGIPQVVFTGGEPTLYKDLPYLVDHAQEFVTGLVTNGTKLTSKLCKQFKDSSLDYIQVTIESDRSKIHDKMVGRNGAWQETTAGIAHAKLEGLDVVTNTTLMRDNFKDAVPLMFFLHDLGIKTMSFNSLICSGKGILCKDNINRLTERELRDTLVEIRNACKSIPMEVQWYTPTCYKNLNPLDFGFGIKNCSAAKFNMTIEPDGRVIPCQSWLHEDCGNILKDDWASIWNSKVAQKARQSHAKDECANCEWIQQCEGSCPLDK